MDNLTKKQEKFYRTINFFIEQNKYLPTIGEIKKITNYKSYNTIHEYIKILIKKNYLTYDQSTKRIGIKNKSYSNNNSIIIPYLNNDNYLKIDKSFLKDNSNYVCFLNDNSNLKSAGINRHDTLIIEKNLTRLNNKLVLINVNNKYKILKYIKKDGFHHLYNDKENIVIENIDFIIGKVIMLIRSEI